jgi:hypothetical protein
MNQLADANFPDEVTNPLPALTPAQMEHQRDRFERCYLATGADARMLTRSGYGYCHRQPDDIWLGWSECARMFYAQTEQLRGLILKYAQSSAEAAREGALEYVDSCSIAACEGAILQHEEDAARSLAQIDALLQYVPSKPQDLPCSTACPRG